MQSSSMGGSMRLVGCATLLAFATGCEPERGAAAPGDVRAEIAYLTTPPCTLPHSLGDMRCSPVTFAASSAEIRVNTRTSNLEGLVSWRAEADTKIESMPLLHAGVHVSLSRAHEKVLGVGPLPSSVVLEASGLATPNGGAYAQSIRVSASMRRVTLTGTISNVARVAHDENAGRCRRTFTDVSVTRAATARLDDASAGSTQTFTTTAPLRGDEVLEELESRVVIVPGFDHPVLAEDAAWVRKLCTREGPHSGLALAGAGPVRPARLPSGTR